MKKFLPVLFCLLALSGLGQNWSPIVLGKKYNYRVTDSTYITNTIWVDSFDVSGLDTTFFFNRIVKSHFPQGSYCPPNVPPEFSCFGWKNQPQFLQRKAKKDSTETYHFSDSISFVIKPKAQLNDIWLFDTTTNINAQITNLDTATIFGGLDSTKTITLNNGDSIVLSKSHGILLFPNFNSNYYYYHLTGTENPNRGETIPNFWDMYSYEVGSVICEVTTSQGDPTSKQIRSTEYQILGKDVYYPNSVVYEVMRIHQFQNINFFGPDHMSADSSIQNITFLNPANSIQNAYNHQLINITELAPENGSYTDVYSFCRLSNVSGNYSKSIGTYDCDSVPFLIVNDSLTDPDLLLFAPVGYFCIYDVYEEGIGHSYGEKQHSHGYSRMVREYTKPEDVTTATCLPINVSISEQSKSNYAISPNPTKGNLNLQFKKPFTGLVILYTQTGQMLLSHSLNNQTHNQINISHLASGIYFLELDKGDERSFEKVVISH